jgi:hypothetical protein
MFGLVQYKGFHGRQRMESASFFDIETMRVRKSR